VSKNKNRVMDMLERRGFVETEPAQASGFDASAFEERQQEAPVPEAPQIPAAAPIPAYTPPPYTPPAYTPPPAAQARESEQIAAFFGGTNKAPSESRGSGAFWDSSAESIAEPQPERYMDIEELYRGFGMKTTGTDTIYLVEDYIKTLPQSLPAELRRSIILKIVAASGFDFDRLLNDGIDRVTRLNDYSNTFSAFTEGFVQKQMEDIAGLERQIAELQDLINERKNLHKRQFLAIENEGQRLKEILDFITK
jgi:hypothetical protein